MGFPRYLSPTEVIVPPLFIQGCKTDLIPPIYSAIRWDGHGTLYDCFGGSGCFGLNAIADRIVISDINPHIISFYQTLAEREFNYGDMHRLLWEAKNLPEAAARKNYYAKRHEFNLCPTPYLFLFLCISSFRNLMRFNSRGEYNSPVHYKNDRYIYNQNDTEGTYIDTILDRVRYAEQIIRQKNIEFRLADFREILASADKSDLVYADPPYYLRNTQYYQKFAEIENTALIEWANTTQAGYAISSWYSDANRINPFIGAFTRAKVKKIAYRYWFGDGLAKSRNQNVKEALILSPSVYNDREGLKKYLKAEEIQ